MIGFVDDSNDQVNIFSADYPPTPETLITMMQHDAQHDAQLWSDLLWASGGALELPKCTYHFLYFDFTPTGEPCMWPGQVGPPLTILSGDRQTTTAIKFRSAFTAHKTLGHRKDPSGNQGKQYEVLLDKSDDTGGDRGAQCTSTQRPLDILFRHLPDQHRIPIGQLSFQSEGIVDHSEEGDEHHLCEMRFLS
jgi:hypothetical protein